MKDRIEIWKQMETVGDPMATEYLKKITAEAKAEGKLQELNEALMFLMTSAEQRLERVEKSVADYTMAQRMGALTEVVNLAYIARQYFGKTRQWLYQRLKGQIVNGKPAEFTPAEEAIFVRALNEIGMRLATFTAR